MCPRGIVTPAHLTHLQSSVSFVLALCAVLGSAVASRTLAAAPAETLTARRALDSGARLTPACVAGVAHVWPSGVAVQPEGDETALDDRLAPLWSPALALPPRWAAQAPALRRLHKPYLLRVPLQPPR